MKMSQIHQQARKKKGQKQRVVIFLGFIVLVALVTVVFMRSVYPRTAVAPAGNQVVSQKDDSQPEPFDFQELTIPYLRSQKYDSSVSELESYSRNQAYESYRTSYQSDSLRINGLLTIPTGEPPAGGFPAVIFVHGYIPPTLYRTEKNYESYVDYLARRGIVVFKIDLRGHDQSEGEASGAYFSGDYVVDVLNAYSAVQKMEQVNQDRVGLWGHSMAGNVVFRALTVKKDIPKAVIWAGAVYTYDDFSTFGIDDTSYRPPTDGTERQRKRNELFDLYGRYDPDSWFWQQVPATNYLDGVKAAIQVHHAVDDSVVDIGYSRNLMQVLDATSIPHQLYEYQSGGHNISGSSFNQAMQRSVEFFLE